MSTETVIPNETFQSDELKPVAVTVESASVSESSLGPSSETRENHVNSEVSNSTGVNTNGSTTNTETTEVSENNPSDSHVDDQDNQPSYSHRTDLEPEAFRKVFIGGLFFKTDEETFREYFSKFGEILDCIIMRDRDGRSRGFGFVTYAAKSMVDKLMKGRPHTLDGREIEPKRATPREDSGKPESSLTAKKLFVGGIREGAINEEDLKKYFSKYGTILDAVIMKTPDGKFRGFGFVEFNDYDPVDVIVLEKHHTINNNSINVEKALPKDQTNRARMNQQQQHYGGSSGSMRGPSNRSNGGGWAPMQNEPHYGGHSHSGNGYPPNGGGHGNYGSGDYGNRSGPYGGNGGYGADIGNNNGARGHNSNMVGYGGNPGPMNGGGYTGHGSGRGSYNDSFGAFGPPPSGPSFGQGYNSSSGGGPMRRGMPPGRGSGAPYSRGRGGGAPTFGGRN